jgi:DNA polymerase-4
VATNKLVAKIANDAGKTAAPRDHPPNAITVVPPGQEAVFLAPLPADALWGVGPKTAARLADIDVMTIGELAQVPEADLIRLFGKNGYDLARRARGIDDRPVVRHRDPKSVSKETTFPQDVTATPVLMDSLRELSSGVGRRLRRLEMVGATVKLKIRWPDFTTLTRQVTLDEPIDKDDEIFDAAEALLTSVWRPGRPVRLIGVGVSGLGPPVRQLTLWEALTEGQAQAATEKEQRLREAVEVLHQRFGQHAIQRGHDAFKGDSE